MNFIKELYKKYKKVTGAFAEISLIILFFFLLSLYDNSPLERLIKLSPEDRADRVKAIQNIDSVIATCKKLNRRFTKQKPYQYWFEDINSYGKWYQPRRSYPTIQVYFHEEPGHSDNGSYCEVDLTWLDYEFYNWETFDVGEDQYGQTHYKSYKNYMCDDDWEERQCTK